MADQPPPERNSQLSTPQKELLIWLSRNPLSNRSGPAEELWGGLAVTMGCDGLVQVFQDGSLL
jgi:hypothetical protein